MLLGLELGRHLDAASCELTVGFDVLLGASCVVEGLFVQDRTSCLAELDGHDVDLVENECELVERALDLLGDEPDNTFVEELQRLFVGGLGQSADDRIADDGNSFFASPGGGAGGLVLGRGVAAQQAVQPLSTFNAVLVARAAQGDVERGLRSLGPDGGGELGVLSTGADAQRQSPAQQGGASVNPCRADYLDRAALAGISSHDNQLVLTNHDLRGVELVDGCSHNGYGQNDTYEHRAHFRRGRGVGLTCIS